MLTRFHKILIGLFAVQLVLAIVLLRHGDEAPPKPAPIVAGFDAAKVTGIDVYANGSATPAVKLARQGGSWVLASAFDYPATDSKVGDVLAAIAKASAAEPVATQAAREQQLRVAERDFERKLVITAGGTQTILFVGGPAGPRRTAVRVGGDSRTWGVTGLDVWAIGDAPAAWIDTSYVKVPSDSIASIAIERAGSAVTLARDGDKWAASIGGAPIALGAGETLDTSAIERAVTAASTIELAAPADPKRDAHAPTATITIARKAAAGAAASAADVVIDVIADGDQYWVHDRASPRAALVAKRSLDDVVELTRDKLVQRAPQAAKPPADKKADAHG